MHLASLHLNWIEISEDFLRVSIFQKDVRSRYFVLHSWYVFILFTRLYFRKTG